MASNPEQFDVLVTPNLYGNLVRFLAFLHFALLRVFLLLLLAPHVLLPMLGSLSPAVFATFSRLIGCPQSAGAVQCRVIGHSNNPSLSQVTNIACGLVGGTSLAPGANLGYGAAIFEQGARDVNAALAGKGIVNPTALLYASVLMLRHLKWQQYADRLEDAIQAVYTEGDKSVLTPDVGGTGTTLSFAEAVISKL